MVKHTKNFLEYYQYSQDQQEYIPCGVCSTQAVDIHHIQYRSQGGNDEIDNLIPLCRTCHDSAHRSLINPEQLQKHRQEFQKMRLKQIKDSVW